MDKIIENLKSGNYELVDNRGVSVTTHFIECLEKELADLEAKLAESKVIIKGGKEEIKDLHRKINEIVERDMNCIQQLKQQLADTDKLMQEYLSKCLSLEEQLAEKEKEIEIEKEVSDWLYDIHNRTKFEEEVTQKYKTATEITKQCNLYEHCKNQFINDLRSEVKKKLKN